MDQLLVAFFLAIVLALFLPPLQTSLQSWFASRPKWIFLVSALLSGLFLIFLWRHKALGALFALLVVTYAFLPAVIAYINGPGSGPHRRDGQSAWLDLVVILLLWMPLELGAGQQLLPKALHGTAHTVAYGVAVTLALFLFLVFRCTPQMKYRLPSQKKDLALPVVGLIMAAPVLAFLGLQLCFLNPFHISEHLSFVAFAKRFATTLAGVALPEEILFRALIQNWIMQKFGFTWKSLFVAAVIFGAAHLNNDPGGFPNWRYMILATIAGVVYGKVFHETTTILSPAALHAAVNTIKYFFFQH
jgi:membrane protease YdiL (CAAX protease family)